MIRAETILAGSMTGTVIHALDVPAETAVDIDTVSDFALAEVLFDGLMPDVLQRWASGRGQHDGA